MAVDACGVPCHRPCNSQKSHNEGGVNAMRGGLRYQAIIAANSLIGSFVLWAVLLSMGGIAAAVLLR